MRLSNLFTMSVWRCVRRAQSLLALVRDSLFGMAIRRSAASPRLSNRSWCHGARVGGDGLQMESGSRCRFFARWLWDLDAPQPSLTALITKAVAGRRGLPSGSPFAAHLGTIGGQQFRFMVANLREHLSDSGRTTCLCAGAISANNQTESVV